MALSVSCVAFLWNPDNASHIPYPRTARSCGKGGALCFESLIRAAPRAALEAQQPSKRWSESAPRGRTGLTIDWHRRDFCHVVVRASLSSMTLIIERAVVLPTAFHSRDDVLSLSYRPAKRNLRSIDDSFLTS